MKTIESDHLRGKIRARTKTTEMKRPRKSCLKTYCLGVFILLSALSETAASKSTLSPANDVNDAPLAPIANDPEGFIQRLGGNAVSSTPSTPQQSPSSADPPLPEESAKDDAATRQAIGSLVFIATTVSLCIVAFFAFIGGAYCWYKHTGISSAARRVFYRSSDSSVLIRNAYQPMGDQPAHQTPGNGQVPTNKNLARLAEKTDYPAYGVTGPNPLHYAPNRPPIDNTLNRHAEVYHYQQQKQKLKALSSASSEGSARSRQSTSETLNDPTTETNDDEENSDGEYTVYECPGLASTTDGPLEIHNPLFADSENSFTSYGASPLGGGVVSQKYTYPATVGNRG